MMSSLDFRLAGVASIAAVGWACLAGGCSSSSTQGSGDGGTSDSSTADSGKMDAAQKDTGTGADTAEKDTAPMETSTMDSPATETGGEAGCSGTELTVIDADDWCTVTVGSNPSFMSGQETYCVPPGTSVNLSATPNAGFMLGSTNWHDQTGTETDTGSVASATETPTTAKACVWVCCPGKTDPCPTMDQCH
jgi:hypothetical protein